MLKSVLKVLLFENACLWTLFWQFSISEYTWNFIVWRFFVFVFVFPFEEPLAWDFPGFPVKVKVTQSCLTLCDPMDYAVHGILQARLLEWINFPFSKGSSQPWDWTQVSSIAGGFFTSSWDQSPNAGALGSIPRSHILQLKIPHATMKMIESTCPTKVPVQPNK